MKTYRNEEEEGNVIEGDEAVVEDELGVDGTEHVDNALDEDQGELDDQDSEEGRRDLVLWRW